MSHHYTQRSYTMVDQYDTQHRIPQGPTHDVHSGGEDFYSTPEGDYEHWRNDYYYESSPSYVSPPHCGYHHYQSWSDPPTKSENYHHHHAKEHRDTSRLTRTPPSSYQKVTDSPAPVSPTVWVKDTLKEHLQRPKKVSTKNVTPTRRVLKPQTDENIQTESVVGSGGGNSPIWDLGEYDIVCGRGAPVNWQTGNHFFRDLIVEYQTVYLCAKRCDKPKIATEILQVIRSRNGRFVRRLKTSFRGRFGWEEIPEKRAYEKICQALREGAPELRRKMIASTKQLRQYAEIHAVV